MYSLIHFRSFIFLEIEASKVRVLQYKVERNIRELLRLIRIHLGVGNRVGPVHTLFSMSCSHRW